MKTVPEQPEGDRRDVLVQSPPGESELRGQPLFGFLLFMTPIVAGLATIHLSPAAGGMAATAMIPLLLISTYLEPFPLSPYTLLASDQQE